jgi:hypothetical protein
LIPFFLIIVTMIGMIVLLIVTTPSCSYGPATIVD